MKMTEVLKADRPREKLAAKGPAALSDFELLQALIGSGNKQVDVSQIARNTHKLLQKYGANVTIAQLRTIVGLGEAKISEIMAAFELSRRYLVESERPIIDSTEKAVAQLADICRKTQEYFMCLTLDGANRLIAKRIITIGTLNSSLVHPREVFANAITDHAASIIVAHNHPSGSLLASRADVQLTVRLRDAGLLLGIPLTEHIIVTKETFEIIRCLE